VQIHQNEAVIHENNWRDTGLTDAVKLKLTLSTRWWETKRGSHRTRKGRL